MQLLIPIFLSLSAREDLNTIDGLYAEVDFCKKRKRNESEGKTVDGGAAIYTEVAEETNQGTGNHTFTTYGLN